MSVRQTGLSLSPKESGALLYYLVSPGALAGTRPLTYLWRVGEGGGSTQPPSDTLASHTTATLPHTVTPL